MKAYVAAPPKLSRAMKRVANALERYAPADVTIVQDPNAADVLVLHVIGLEAVNYREDKPCAVLQYCVNSATKEGAAPWHPLWNRALTVWSYYNLAPLMPEDTDFYYAPMGIDRVFREPRPNCGRDYLVLTSGYVNGHGQEAIEEPTVAAEQCGGKAIHLGPMPTGITRNVEMNLATDISDVTLASIYRRCQFVTGLRYVEGFEMPAIEGLVNGARPVVFDRAEMRHWYQDSAVYVPECSGLELIDRLTAVFSEDRDPVSNEEREWALARFNWKTLAEGFWNRVKEQM